MTTSPFEAFSRYEQDHGLPIGFIRTVNATDPDANAWARLERGEIDLEEFSCRFESEARALGYAVDAAAIIDLLGGDVRPAMVDALRSYAKRYRTGLLTNNFSLARPSAPARAEEVAAVVGIFDVVVESSKVGVRKPEERFFEIACEMLEIAPQEAVFVDDLGVNLKPARKLGMTTIKFVTEAQALNDLDAVLGARP